MKEFVRLAKVVAKEIKAGRSAYGRVMLDFCLDVWLYYSDFNDSSTYSIKLPGLNYSPFWCVMWSEIDAWYFSVSEKIEIGKVVNETSKRTKGASL